MSATLACMLGWHVAPTQAVSPRAATGIYPRQYEHTCTPTFRLECIPVQNCCTRALFPGCPAIPPPLRFIGVHVSCARNAWTLQSSYVLLPLPLPRPMLQGDYGLQVIARGMDGSELACVNVEFSLVMPGGALGSSSSSRTGSISSSRESGSRKALRAVW